MFERLELLVNDKIEAIKNKRVLIIGLGGVGGYALETLVRSGIENITIVDNDTIDITNINRQLISLNENIGTLKTEAWDKRIKSINPNCKVNTISKFITKENLNELFTNPVDYVIDACDTLETKKEIIKYCLQNNIKIISSMGMGNRIDSTKIKLITLDKTNYDPLAKKLRTLLRHDNVSLKVPVVSSTEQPLKRNKVGSAAHVVGVSGLLITNYIINDILKENNFE